METGRASNKNEMLSRRVLSKEEESQTTDAEVTRDDQDRINRFSSLHTRSKAATIELEAKKSQLSDFNDLSTELELQLDDEAPIQYKVGDSFFAVPLEEAQEMLKSDTEEIEKEIEILEEEQGVLKEEMDGLKAQLYARFGRGINLEA